MNKLYYFIKAVIFILTGQSFLLEEYEMISDNELKYGAPCEYLDCENCVRYEQMTYATWFQHRLFWVLDNNNKYDWASTLPGTIKKVYTTIFDERLTDVIVTWASPV